VHRASARGAIALSAAVLLAAAASGGKPASADGASATLAGAKAGASPGPAASALPPLADDVARVRAELHGIRQSGLVLGSPRAPLIIIEYADLACSACARVHRNVLPGVIARFVRSGQATLEFRSVAAGKRSRDLALAAHAASPQHRGWDYIQLVYLRSRPVAGAGPGPAEPPASLVAALGLDLATWRMDLGRPQWSVEIDAAASVVKLARFRAAPAFLVRRRGHPGPFVVVTEPRSVGALAAAVASARRS
jgi:hypothetical protein